MPTDVTATTGTAVEQAQGASNEDIATGYGAGDPTGGATGAMTGIEDRQMNQSGAFSKAAPEATIAAAMNPAGFTSFEEDPATGLTTSREGIQDFQAIMLEQSALKAEERTARKESVGTFGLVTDPETGKQVWGDGGKAGHTEEFSLAEKSNSQFETNSLAYTSTNVEDTMLAFDAEEGTGEEEEYWYGDEEGPQEAVASEDEGEPSSGSGTA